MATLHDLFELEQIERDRFRGISHDVGFRNLFGGHVLGQGLLAASRTVEEDRAAHSLHAYFLRPGDAQAPIDYRVDRTRDGRGFTCRHVLAIQHGQPILELLASFQLPEDGLDHQQPMPLEVPPPESLDPLDKVVESLGARLTENQREVLRRPRPVEIRLVDPQAKFTASPRPATKQLWLRAADPLPEDPRLHVAALVYASDFELLGTAMLPHGVSFLSEGVRAASLDHAVWLHRPFRADDWLLYCTDSPNAAGGRGLSRGHIYRRDGTLVASVAQEGLMRVPSAR